ncbi:MAG: hypothetical protein WC141_05195 [Arcobacteraceae bacterium]
MKRENEMIKRNMKDFLLRFFPTMGVVLCGVYVIMNGGLLMGWFLIISVIFFFFLGLKNQAKWEEKETEKRYQNMKNEMIIKVKNGEKINKDLEKKS